MKNKTILLTGTIILTIILFAISTHMQKKLIDYKPQIKCLFAKEDIMAGTKLEPEMFILNDIDIALVANVKIITDYKEIENLYAKDNIYRGQIALKKQFDTKENLSIYEIEEGKEKISIKIKSAENGVSYSLKNNSIINVYATMRMELAQNFLKDKERLEIGTLEDGYVVLKILENINVLEAFDIDGIEMKNSDSKIIDTILIPVTSEEAKAVSLLRDIATFNISEN